MNVSLDVSMGYTSMQRTAAFFTGRKPEFDVRRRFGTLKYEPHKHPTRFSSDMYTVSIPDPRAMKKTEDRSVDTGETVDVAGQNQATVEVSHFTTGNTSPAFSIRQNLVTAHNE